MSRLGVAEHIKKVTDMLSPHLDTATSMLASFLVKNDEEPGPEEKLAEFLRWREWRRKMGYSDDAIEEEVLELLGDEYERTVVCGDADHAGSRLGSSGNSGHADHGIGKGDRAGHQEPDGKDKFYRIRGDKI